MPRPDFHPSALLLDDGRAFDGNAYPRGNFHIGHEQSRLRRDAWRQHEWENRNKAGQPGYGLGLSSGGRLISGPLRDPAWDAYFGLMQAKENAAAFSGKRFNVDLDSWGNSKDMDEPSGRVYSRDAREVAPGLRGRPSRAVAAMTGADTGQKGYYRPDEFEHARQGLERAFRGLR